MELHPRPPPRIRSSSAALGDEEEILSSGILPRRVVHHWKSPTYSRSTHQHGTQRRRRRRPPRRTSQMVVEVVEAKPILGRRLRWRRRWDSGLRSLRRHPHIGDRAYVHLYHRQRASRLCPDKRAAARRAVARTTDLRCRPDTAVQPHRRAPPPRQQRSGGQRHRQCRSRGHLLRRRHSQAGCVNHSVSLSLIRELR